jgi:hypothetical protein
MYFGCTCEATSSDFRLYLQHNLNKLKTVLTWKKSKT